MVPVFSQWINVVETTDQRQEPVVKGNVKGVVATDSTYFAMVPYAWLAGSPATALNAPENVVLTESRAKSYFGTTAPEAVLGKIITYNKEKKRTVTGIVKDLGYPTEFTGQEFFRLPPATYSLGQWTSTDGANRVYLQLGPGTDTAKVLAMVTKVAGEKWEENLQDSKLPRSIKRWFKLIPLTESHFSTYIPEWEVRKASKPVMHGLIGLGLLLIIAASINFVNLATTIAIIISCLGLFGLAVLIAFQRTKEIGIRKVLGATVTGIIQMLMLDFVKLVLIALVIAAPIAWWGMSKWLQNFVYRISIEWWMFALSGAVVVLIAIFTVSFQAVRAALANPVKSLRSM
ncbi:hypothetical protein UNH65_11930 [Chitinophaga sp. 180180018-2]|nr:hypothetical protein [Chitinophaga sp. 212800010-3]